MDNSLLCGVFMVFSGPCLLTLLLWSVYSRASTETPHMESMEAGTKPAKSTGTTHTHFKFQHTMLNIFGRHSRLTTF